MVQFKPYFLGESIPPNRRLASCQKCFRTTDIEAVGDTKHLTFFEMLGNFSVGDYFKREAISWAWEFVTQRLALPRERLWITIYLADEEAFVYWQEMGVPGDRILRLGEEANYWGPAGESGPCGPCSEILYDMGQGVGCQKPSCGPSCDCGRFLEIWNLVFTQYNQDSSGQRASLPKPNIDTGMGLERAAAAVHGKASVYETDLFVPLIERVSELAGCGYGGDERTDHAIKVVAEHSRGMAFLIADGVIPDSAGPGKVLRRVMRRATLFGSKLGLEEPFLTEMAKAVIDRMGHVYPELEKQKDFILKVVDVEEARFSQTLVMGLGIFQDWVVKPRQDLVAHVRPLLGQLERRDPWEEEVIAYFRSARPSCEVVTGTFESLRGPFEELKAHFERVQDEKGDETLYEETEAAVRRFLSDTTRISGDEVFMLYDTYGFPQELTAEVAAEHGFEVDQEGFEEAMERQRARARAAQKFGRDEKELDRDYHELGIQATPFVGYDSPKHETVIAGLFVNGQPLQTASPGQETEVVLLETPFYGEMGGQVADSGEIRGPRGEMTVAHAFRPLPELIVHRGQVSQGELSVGDSVEAEVDAARRLDIARNHTATHLLQAALRQVLGEHVVQRGSLVAPERFRFDFSHLGVITAGELEAVQRLVNERIRQNLPLRAKMAAYRQAVAQGAIALFDEKYGDEVRVVEIGKPAISAELCGGTHVRSTGEIGSFHIVSEGSIGAGLRRIEAIAGRGAEAFVEGRLSTLETISLELQTSPAEVRDKVSALLAELARERKRSLASERELAKKAAESLIDQVKLVDGVRVLSARVSASSMEALREMGDLLRNRLQSAIIVLGTVCGNQPNFVAVVTPDLVARGFNAAEIVKRVAEIAGGSGGGKAELGQAGGKNKDKLDEALRQVEDIVRTP
jgi:alanyl-tRNA synthetase